MDLTGLINKNKNKVFNIALIILSLFIASKIYDDQSKKIDALKAGVIEEGKKNQALEGISKSKDKIDAYRRLLVKKDASSYMNDISGLARDAEVKILSIKPSGEEVLPEYTKYIFDLQVSSSDYDSLAKFVNSLEMHKTVYTADTLDIAASSYNKDKEIKADLRVSAVAMVE